MDLSPSERIRLQAAWNLRPDIAYLNHGSFGPAPRAVLEVRDHWQRELQREPVDFFVRQLGPLLDAALGALARFVKTSPENLVFVDNATTGMNAVAETFHLSAGDEVLINDHEYGAVRRIWERACRRTGAAVATCGISVPIQSDEQLLAELFSAVTPRTRLLVVSHITSPTALIFPVAEICREARRRGLAVCIDGPHALAQVEIDLESLDCDFYTASCHKWLAAPFGSGMLYVHPRRQTEIQPAVLSWGNFPARSEPSWRQEFSWVGTRDPAAWLAVPAAIEFLEQVGLDRFRRHTHRLAAAARQRIGSLTGRAPICPDDPRWYGSMATVPLPPGEAEPLHQRLFDRHRIEVPIVSWNGQRFVRVSCHLYTREEELERLATALECELGRE